MAITFNNNFKIGIGAPIDSKYLDVLNQPYSSTGATNAAILQSQRYTGLTVNILGVEYWYKNGTSDIDLVLKTASSSGGTGTITGGTNGLGITGANVCLGGTLINPTIIIDASGVGIQYASDYSGTFIDESLITKKYVNSKFSGTTFHVPVFNAIVDGLQDTTLLFQNNVICNCGALTIETAPSTCLYLISPSGTYNNIALGKSSMSSAITWNYISSVGLASNIGVILSAKGSGETKILSTNVTIGSSGPLYNTLNYASNTLRMPRFGRLCAHGGLGVTGLTDGDTMCIIGAQGMGQVGFAGAGGNVCIIGGAAQDGIGGTPKAGGDIVLKRGCGISGGANGNVKICNLPLKSSEINVIYYDTTNGNLSYGLATGGTGSLVTGANNGLTLVGTTIKLGGTLTGSTIITDGRITKTGIEYAADYSSTFSPESLITKRYVDNIKYEKISKIITQLSHGFTVGDVIGWSGGTYNKAIADGTYDGEILGIVTYVNGNDFELTEAGYITGLTGLLTNNTYFLSDVTAGLLTATEPLTFGHISKAVLIADFVSSGWVLPYAGYVISSGGTGADTNGERITKIITQPAHGFVVNNVVGWSSGIYTKAIANGTYNGEVIGLVTKVTGDTFEVTQAGYISGLTTLSANTTYFLSNVSAGQLTPIKPTTLTHIIRAVLVTTTANAGWVLPYPGYTLASGNTVTGTTVAAGLGLTDSASTFNVNIINASALGAEIPVKINYVGNNRLYIDSNDIIGDKNNIYSKTIVTGNTLLTTGSNYVILVNSSGATVTLTLPLSPIDGQAFKIKDVANVALTYNITIARNGKYIDSAANDAIINTNGGSLELMYDNILGSWYILAFVN